MPGVPQGFEETPFTFVDTAAALQGMSARLATVRELAVDLEHHSHRSFQGITCLMQISTRSEDFVVDTIALRSDLGADAWGSGVTPCPKSSIRAFQLRKSCSACVPIECEGGLDDSLSTMHTDYMPEVQLLGQSQVSKR